MKHTLTLGALQIAMTLIFLHTAMNAVQNDDTRSLTLLEQQWITDFESRKSGLLEKVLSHDFVYVSEAGVLAKREFIALVEKFDLSSSTIQLNNKSVHVHGLAAVSSGSVVLLPKTSDQIKGESKVAAKSAVVNVGESVRKEPPPTTRTARVVPAPMPVPQNSQVLAPARHRYTAMYVKVVGRWRLVALHLSCATND